MPRQAVILAGGRGTRLMPLTATRPKPMIEFHGRPFLAYLIDYLRGQGIERVLLLLGYMPDVIRDHFGDGSAFGVSIEYQVSDVEDDTGRRLKLAEEKLEPEFFLLYCDNYLPLNLPALSERFRATGVALQCVAYRNDDNYSKSNLRIGDDGTVLLYDKSRQSPDLAGVDVGFMLVKRDVLTLIPPDENVSFEAMVYPRLVAEGKLGAVWTDHRYYSVGDHRRLPMTEAFLARRPTIFLDRDGTLNRRPPPAEYITRPEEWEWLPGALVALRRLTEAGWRIVIVTNQPGLARGMLRQEHLVAIHRRMTSEAEAAGAEIEDILVCPHGWDDGCKCRKPAPGMLFEAQRRHHLDLSRTPLIGDDQRDGAAAAAAGCPYHVLAQGECLLDSVERLLDKRWEGPWNN